MFLGMLSKLRSRRLVPKEKPAKVKKRKPIPTKSTFKRFDNPLKSYRVEPTENIRRKAEQCRAQQISAANNAELYVGETLRLLKLPYRYQHIVYRPGSYVCLDYLLNDFPVAVEVDGKSHALTRGYDSGRDKWLKETHGITTVRLTVPQAFDRALSNKIIMAVTGN